MPRLADQLSLGPARESVEEGSGDGRIEGEAWRQLHEDDREPGAQSLELFHEALDQRF